MTAEVQEIQTVQTVDKWAAVIIFLTSFLGVIVNTFIALYIRRLAMLRNSFGRLLQLQAVGDAIFTSVWAFYFAPTLFFNITPLQNIAVASRFAQLCLICYDISIYTHLIISFNRFISLYCPTKYAMIFTDRFTNVLVFGTVAVSFAFSWFLVSVDCVMMFSIPRWMLDYDTSTCNMINVYYAEFMRGLVVIVVFAIVNSLTFIRMNIHNSKKKTNSSFETAQQAKRRSAKKKFVQQVTIQGMIYVIELVTYFYVATFFPVNTNISIENNPNRWPNFLLTTYAWILVHTLDGVVTLVFNRQFHKIVVSKSIIVSKNTPSRRISANSNRSRTTSCNISSKIDTALLRAHLRGSKPDAGFAL